MQSRRSAFELGDADTDVRLDPYRSVSVGCRPGGRPWYSQDQEKTDTAYRTKDGTMRAVRLSTHGGPEVLQVVELPEVHAGAGQVGSASMRRRSTRPTSGYATASAQNSRRLIRRRTCQKWRRRGSSTRLEAAFLTNSRLATPSWRSSCQKAAMARIASKLRSMSDRSSRNCRKDPSGGRHLADERANGAPVALCSSCHRVRSSR